jgi:tetratricopeptide (TPR) repeat protein
MLRRLPILVVAIASAAFAPPQHRPPAPSDLDNLFTALAKTRTAEDAKPIETQIQNRFLASGSPSVDLLMTRAAAALAGGDKVVGRKLLDAVTGVAPNYAEGWHQRGKMQADEGDDAGAIISLNKAVTINPRQFEAFAELGEVLLADGDKKDALGQLRKALALDPHLDNLDRQVERLSRDVEGEKI